MISTQRAFLIILIMAAVTLATRALPFLIFPEGKRIPERIVLLGKVLPPAIIGILVIYCLRNISLTGFPFGIPELVSVAIVVLLHVWKRSNLISICGGTALYMVLVQTVL